MADSSLDDIIKQRKIRPLLQQRININDIPWQSWTSLEDNMDQDSYYDQEADIEVMGDVRNKIIHNKRLRMVDARDRLAELAKQGDARDRINKIRMTTAPPAKTGQWKNTGPNEKKIRNENRPSNLGGKTQMQGSKLTRTVAGGDVTEPKVPRMRGKPGPPPRPSANGRNHNAGRAWDSNRFHPLPNNPHVVTIKNEKAELHNTSNSHEMTSPRMRERRTQGEKYPPRPMMRPTARPFSHSVGQPVSRPVLASSGYSGRGGVVRARSPGPPQHLYRPRSPQLQEVVRPTRLKITTTNNYREPSPPYGDEWELPARPPPARMPVARMPPSHLPDSPPQRMAVRPAPKKRPVYEDEEEIIARAKKVAPLSSGLLARLDQPQRPVAPQGYKVLVTNLHLCVSGEDMEELFGTIGPILSARMLREGVAEAVFVSQEDAYRSVEVFNHRQLDGQPMCVSVVGRHISSGPPPHPPPSSHTTSVLKAASGSVGGGVTRSSMGLVSRGRQEEVIAPDIRAIHQALFNRSQPPPSSQHNFRVKLPKPPVRREVI